MASTFNIITDEGIKEIISKTKESLENKVDKITGKSLSTNDFSDTYKQKVDDAASQAAQLVADGAEANKIDVIKVNSTPLSPSVNKEVDITVPTGAQIKSQIEAYGYQTSTQVDDIVSAKGYQTSSQVDTAITSKGYQTATQVNTAIEGKGYQTSTQVQDAINEALSGITGINILVVDALPETGETGTIYLVSRSHGTSDNYDEYVWVSSAGKFEKIGNTDVDLSNYTKTTDFTDVGATEIDTLWDAVSI